MRILRVLPLLFTVALLWLLDHPMGALPAVGRIIDPVNGALAAAERVDQDFNKNIQLKGLQAPVSIWLEERLVPHVRAQNDHDLYYTQGYLHAYFRLWQMDLQTRAAGGRVSEVAGPKAIEFDRGQRRKGMVLGANRSLEAMERDPRTKLMLDAYRDGINAYIHSLNYRSLPIEYKLMGFYPEDWTNLRTSLMAKNLADDLTSKTDDIAFTILRDQLGQEQFDFLFPERIKGSKPVIPEGTPFSKPSLTIPQYPGDSVWAHFPETLQHSNIPTFQHSNTSAKTRASRLYDPPSNDEPAKGSNNWAISGAHTASGKPILCNDPHLSLNLPSLWFEMQLTAPGVNVYGASLPGAPGIVIGFNQQISWGFTNNYRDVKDFYEIQSVSGPSASLGDRGERPPSGVSRPRSEAEAPDSPWIRPSTYIFSGKTIPFERSVEVIKVKGGPDVIDTVLYTLHGPVNYDPSFPDHAKSGKLLACTWMGQRGSNEMLGPYLLNRAGNYAAFTEAIKHFECPAQNIAYADGAGNIAIWGQGRFINKWKGQGKYVMEGHDSLTLWGEAIPTAENPHVLNPPQGFVASANQSVTDSTYPYWYNGSFVEWRSWEINESIRRLTQPNHIAAITEREMQVMQNDVQSLLASRVLQTLLKNCVDVSDRYIPGLREWDGRLEYNKVSASLFQAWWFRIYEAMWRGEHEFNKSRPSSELTARLILDDTADQKYEQLIRDSYFSARDSVASFYRGFYRAGQGELTEPAWWYRVKNTTLNHLAKIPAFSYDHLKIGGWSNTINAVTGQYGPSWRMIVEMDSLPKAYAVYPGGQSGNPGSPHYGDFIDHWVEGKYFTIQFITAAITQNPFKYTWTLSP